jgi:hypothetical protein
MPHHHPDFQKQNPHRPASWRWGRACHLRDEGARPPAGTDDGPTLLAVEYLHALDSPRCPERPDGRLLHSYPGLHAAHHLHEQGGEARWELEARLLARQSSNEIAESIPVETATVDAYEAYFFNVRDRLLATDWVYGRLIGSCQVSGFGRDTPGLWKAVGYAGGPLALGAVIAVTTDRPDASPYPPDVLRVVRRLIDLLVLPPDAPLQSIESYLDVREAGGRTRTSAAGHAGVYLDEVIAEIGEVVKGTRSAKGASSTAPTPRPQPRLGKKVKRGATAA